jgi:putative sterol carrier protein
MAKFDSPETAYKLFAKLFEILLGDETFVSKARESDLSIHLIHTKPDVEMFVSPDAGVVGKSPSPSATIRIKMSCDTAHELWMGKLLMPLALATGKVRVKGSVAKVLEFVPILRPAFDVYPQLVAERGISA